MDTEDKKAEVILIMKVFFIIGFILSVAANSAGFVFSADIQENFHSNEAAAQDYNGINPRLKPSETGLENGHSVNGLIADTVLQTTVPSYFIELWDYVVLVEKSTQKLYLYDKDYKLIKLFNITTGLRQGDKKGMGDLKTPEGIYFFTMVKDERELLPEYGVMALPINYPNFIDTILHKNGNGIWLHATNQPARPLKPFDTRGCVVAANEDILELAEYIKLQTTPMIIVEKIEYDTFEKIASARNGINLFVKNWQTSWENKDIDSYMDSYSKSFKANDMDWKSWRKYKERLNRQYKYINISLSDVKILRHNNYAVASFVQRYKNNKLTNLGIKRLYLVYEEDKWKIIGEEWNPVPALQPANIAKRYAAMKMAKLETSPDKTATLDRTSFQQASFESPPAESSSATQSIASKKTTTLPDHVIQKEPLASSKEQTIDIEGFTIDREKAGNKIRFKLVNKTMEQYKISGRLAIIATNRNDKGIRYTSYPPMILEQGTPKNFKKGEWFSIRRFKIVNGEVEERLVNHVVVMVYSNTGELLLQKEFPI
ncbi:MAG: L,D-transpeptidase [Deltaproteobacteria bacterium]|nr:L,D-transpeptidase [Deltaproteobacteria bacterium]